MRSILLSAIFLLSLGACGSEEEPQPESQVETQSVTAASGEVYELGACCGGGCYTPTGYCCNEGHCGGNCDESLPVWDHAGNPTKLN
ncbi:MAG: hypothetical protein CMJ94_00265 [Planctomycetes bacterium]|nr:hypothetical protein [Planctomycetota bacterium]